MQCRACSIRSPSPRQARSRRAAGARARLTRCAVAAIEHCWPLSRRECVDPRSSFPSYDLIPRATTPRLALDWNFLTTPELPSVPFASVELLRSLSLLRVRACVHHPCRRVVRRRQGSVAKLTGSWCSGIWKPMREPTSDDVDDGLFQFHLCNTKEQCVAGVSFDRAGQLGPVWQQSHAMIVTVSISSPSAE